MGESFVETICCTGCHKKVDEVYYVPDKSKLCWVCFSEKYLFCFGCNKPFPKALAVEDQNPCTKGKLICPECAAKPIEAGQPVGEEAEDE